MEQRRQRCRTLLDTMTVSDDDRDLLAIDWRNDDEVLGASIFIARIGLESCGYGMPIHEGGLLKMHKTLKGKIFFDFVTNVEENLRIIERRIYLPVEDRIVLSLFRATRDKTRT